MATTEVRVTRLYRSSPESVFDALLDARKVAAWFGPGLGEMVRIRIDARVGGEFSIVQRREGQEVDHVGEYIELDRPNRLVFTWSVPRFSPDADIVTVDLARRDGHTELTLIHELQPEWQDYAPNVAASWSRMLSALEGTLGNGERI